MEKLIITNCAADTSMHPEVPARFAWIWGDWSTEGQCNYSNRVTGNFLGGEAMGARIDPGEHDPHPPRLAAPGQAELAPLDSPSEHPPPDRAGHRRMRSLPPGGRTVGLPPPLPPGRPLHREGVASTRGVHDGSRYRKAVVRDPVDHEGAALRTLLQHEHRGAAGAEPLDRFATGCARTLRRRPLQLVGEHHGRPQRLPERTEARGAVGVDQGRGGEVHRDLRARCASRRRQVDQHLGVRGAEQGVARHEQPVRALQPRSRGDLVQPGRGPGVGGQ